MCRVRCTVLIYSMVGIAVVSCDENNVIMFDGLSHNLLHAAVNASDSGTESWFLLLRSLHMTFSLR